MPSAPESVAPIARLDGAQATLTIDLAALADNWRLMAARAAPAACGAAVKADAYGIGVEAAVPALAAAGCGVFFVAHLSEALRARRAAPDAEIYLLHGPPESGLDALRAARVKPVIGSAAQFSAWRALGGGPSALQIDTGMNRLGLAPGEAAQLAADDLAGLGVDLALSHFVASEERDNPLNDRQIADFMALRARFPGLRASLANSSGLFLPRLPALDLARPGYALYGGNPTPGDANPMRAVVTLEAPILQLRWIAASESVGYNAQWTAKRRSRIATIGVGYADGFPRSASARDARPGAEAIVAGRRLPLAGRVSMDL
ncbi:MAG: alanine racemase, partial [Methylobacteriaceae bacterium]|nr:alanine racemase [Methylobacteriaceae bacterium]